MPKSLPIEEGFKDVMEKSFPELAYYHHIEKMRGKINVFFIELADEETLGELWDKIRNVVAVYYQNHLETDFERWNIYIMFVLPITVSNGLKYKIENDQLSSRKIVISNFENKLDAKNRKELLSTYVNNDLSLPKPNINPGKRLSEYTSTSEVFSVINNPNKAREGKDQLHSFYENLLNKLKNEDSEG